MSGRVVTHRVRLWAPYLEVEIGYDDGGIQLYGYGTVGSVDLNALEPAEARALGEALLELAAAREAARDA